jgi:hypothetical protein
MLPFIGICFFMYTPNAFSYQVVVRNSSGETVANQQAAFQISRLQDAVTGSLAPDVKWIAYGNFELL